VRVFQSHIPCCGSDKLTKVDLGFFMFLFIYLISIFFSRFSFKKILFLLFQSHIIGDALVE
jgi:hypothetical protein